MEISNPLDIGIDNVGVFIQEKTSSSSSVVNVVHEKLDLDISPWVTGPDEAATRQEELISHRLAETTLNTGASSYEDEQVVSRVEEHISEVVFVPQVATVIKSEVTQQTEEITLSAAAVVPSSPSTPSLTSLRKQRAATTPGGSTKWREVESVFSPPIDIVELKDSYHLYAEVPGMNVKDISIDLSDNLFSLTGDKRDHPLLVRKNKREEEVVKQEINKGRFKRVLELPEDVDPNDVNVAYEGGILQFKIRKIDNGEKSEVEDESEEVDVEEIEKKEVEESEPEPEASVVSIVVSDDTTSVSAENSVEKIYSVVEEQVGAVESEASSKRANRRKKSSCVVQ